MVRMWSGLAAILVAAQMLSTMPLASARAQTADPIWPHGIAIDQPPVTVHYPRATAPADQKRETALAIKPGGDIPAERDGSAFGHMSYGWSNGPWQPVQPLSGTPMVNRPTLLVPTGTAQTTRTQTTRTQTPGPARPIIGLPAITQAPWTYHWSSFRHLEQDRLDRTGGQRPLTVLWVAPAGHRLRR